MRKLIYAIVACSGIALWSAPTIAQSTESAATQPQQREMFCDHDIGTYCTQTTEQRYEACSNLAVKRGERQITRGFDRFVYECLTGTIGTEPH
jgi:hypothetical protein